MTHVLALCLALLALTAPASAANPGGNTGGNKGGGGGACWKDAEKLCPDAKPGSGLIAPCLEKHLAKLSPACLEEHPEWKLVLASTPTAKGSADPRAAWREVCGQAFEANCAKTEPASAKAIASCLLKVPEKTRDAWPAACRAMIKRRAPAAKPKKAATSKKS